MRLKTYQTETVEAAVRLAGIELGSNAVFLGSRKNDVGDDPTARYEVSFAVPDRDGDMSEQVQQPQLEPAGPGGGGDRFTQRVSKRGSTRSSQATPRRRAAREPAT